MDCSYDTGDANETQYDIIIIENGKFSTDMIFVARNRNAVQHDKFGATRTILKRY